MIHSYNFALPHRVGLALTLVLLFAATVSAQITSGSISGTVVDPSSQVIPAAELTLINEVNGETRAGATNASGDFNFSGLGPSTYTVRVTAPGFQVFERTGNVLLAAGRLSVGRLQMQLGSVTESIVVSAQGGTVQTTSSNHESVIDSTQVSMISLRGRDPISLLRILPGVSQGQDADLFGGSYATSVPQFQGRGGNTIYVDGVNGGDGNGGGNFSGQTNIDAIAEVNVQMASYTAEYGRSGGTQIQFITKRGGSEYHGTGYWYKRHEMFNATNFFNNLNNIQKPVYRFQTLGGNIGGPVPIGGLKDKLFFFYSIDDTQVVTPIPLFQYTMPTVAEKNGDYSLSPRTIVDPLNNNTPFANGLIPANRKDPLGSAIMNILPDPNVSGGTGFNFLIQETDFQHPRRQHLFRIDVRPTDKDTISFKGQTWFTKSVGYEVAGGPSEWGLVRQRYDFTADQATLHYTRIVNPNIVNEFMVGIFYSTEYAPFPEFDEKANAPTRPFGDVGGAELTLVQKQTRGLAGLQQFAPQHNPLNLIPQATWTGLPQAGFRTPDVRFDGRTPLTGADTALTSSNNLTYNRGAHTFKMGAWWEKGAARQARAGIFSGRFNFNHDANDPGSLGYAFANSYVGHFRLYEEDLGRPPSPDRVQHSIAWFVQDTWKVNQRLTLDIGLRMYRWGYQLQQGDEASIFSWERFDPTWGGNPPVLYNPVSTPAGRRAQNPLTGAILPASYIASIVPGTGYSCSGVITATTPCLFNGIVTQDNGGTYLDSGGRGFIEPLAIQFDPRFGLAWDVFGDGKTAVRAAWGAYHEAAGGDPFTGGPAFRYTQMVLFSDISSMFSAIPFTNPTNVSGQWRENQKRRVTHQYNLGIQREVGWNTVLDVAYVGSVTRHNPQNWNFNLLPQGIRFRPESADPTRPATPLPDNFLRPYVGFGDMNQSGPATTSRYDSLQVQVNRRFTGGVEVAGSYTYANGIDNGWYQQLNSINARNRNTLLQTHVLNLSYVIDLPNASKVIPGAAARWILDNWQVSGITTFASGFPQNVNLQTTDGFDFVGGGESCGVVQTGPAQLPHGDRAFDRWFDTSVFQRPSGRGDIGNNCQNYKFRGPGFNNWDVSLFKNIRVAEGKEFQLRWEMYNAFNHTQFSTVNSDARFNPAGQQVNANFGRVTAARNERRMQMSLRFNF
jgi:hypothetical protein